MGKITRRPQRKRERFGRISKDKCGRACDIVRVSYIVLCAKLLPVTETTRKKGAAAIDDAKMAAKSINPGETKGHRFVATFRSQRAGHIGGVIRQTLGEEREEKIPRR